MSHTEPQTLRDLTPGMILRTVLPNKRMTFVGLIEKHPLFSGTAMVIWRDCDSGVWYHDSLPASMAVSIAGDIEPYDPVILKSNLRRALLHPSQLDDDELIGELGKVMNFPSTVSKIQKKGHW